MIPAKYWSPTKKLMVLGAMAGGKLVEDTATGNPLAFITDKAKPLKSLLIPFTPQQSGTGDPSPQNIRPIVPWDGLKVWNGGKNLFNSSDGIELTTNMIRFARNRGYGVPFTMRKGFTYTVSINSQERMPSEWQIQKPFTGVSIKTVYGGTKITYTPDEDVEVAVMAYWQSGGRPESVTDFQIEIGSVASAFEEYKPITETDIVFPAMGKNLLNPAKYLFSTNTSRGLTFEVQSDGSVKVTGITESSDFGPGLSVRFQLPAGTYYGYRDDGDVYITYRKATTESGGETTGLISPFTLDGSEWVYCNIYVRNPGTFDTIIHPQIARENTQTAYEPFTNSVYGGTLDLVSGVLTVKRVGIVRKWSDGTIPSPSGQFIRKLFLFDVPVKGVETYVWSRCNVAPEEWSVNSKTHYYINENKAYLWLPNDTDGDLEVQFVAVLVTPQEIQLTPAQITALIGDNTIWSDADGSMTAVYLKKG